MAYMRDEDPGKVLAKERRPLTSKKSFAADTTIGKQERKTIFGQKFAFYEDEYINDMSGAGCKLGPGPAAINLRDYNSSHGASIKGNLPLERRHIGEPKPNHKFIPAPTDYQV
jgi:hypothetical protein